jgi:hypothetical protein
LLQTTMDTPLTLGNEQPWAKESPAFREGGRCVLEAIRALFKSVRKSRK